MAISLDNDKFGRIEDKIAELCGGNWKYAGSGSERGYTHAGTTNFCGFVRRGFRSGLYKVQLGGLGGPHGNSSTFTTNLYYRQVNGRDED